MRGAVCVVPGGRPIFVTIFKGTCYYGFCGENIDCGSIFGVQCGSLLSPLSLRFDPTNVQLVAPALQVLGLGNISTISSLYLQFWAQDIIPVKQPLQRWVLDIFPNLEVVQNELQFDTFYDNDVSNPASTDTPIVLLPGPGLAKLRAVGFLSSWPLVLKGMQNTDFAFLSSLQCIGSLGYSGASLTSLHGLENVSDMTPGSRFEFHNSVLSDVSALSRLARCGPSPRYDGSHVFMTVTCGNLTSWAGVCDYIAKGSC